MDLKYNPFTVPGAVQGSAERIALLLDDATLTQHISQYGMGGNGHAPPEGVLPPPEHRGSD